MPAPDAGVTTVVTLVTVHLPGSVHGFPPGEEINIPSALAGQLLAHGSVRLAAGPDIAPPAAAPADPPEPTPVETKPVEAKAKSKPAPAPIEP